MRALERDSLIGHPTVLAFFCCCCLFDSFSCHFRFSIIRPFYLILKLTVVGLVGIHGAIAAKAVELVIKNVIGLAQIQFLKTVEHLV